MDIGMGISNANLIVTNATWGETINPLADALAKDGKRYWVDVDVCPLSTLELPNDARQRAVLREFSDWDDVKDSRPLRVIAANPYAPEALEQFEALIMAFKLRKERLKYVALDDDTALAFSEIVRFVGIDQLSPREILTPMSPGSSLELSKLIGEDLAANELCIVLEEIEEAGGVAKRLIAAGHRVIRMPIFGRTKNNPDLLKLSDAPNFILVNDPYALSVAVQGLKRLAADLNEIVWVGNSALLQAMVKRDAPGSSWLDVSDLRHDVILERVSKY
ncbi:hypothetical protein OAQ35_05440 [Litorivicinus sp.]|nr:hypothetical protein [Litorivicinus sp.]